MEFLVDDREPRAFRRLLVDLGAAVARLPHGDVVAGPWVVERKTVGDFASSLTGGRLLVQAAQLREGGGRPVLALEGSLDELADPLRRACLGAMASIAGPLGIPVVPTGSLEGTRDFVQSLRRRDAPDAVEVPEPLVKLRRAEPYVAMLAQAPGLGPRRAALAAARWPSFEALCAARFTGLVDELGPGTAAGLWRVLHGCDVPEVYRRLGTGKRARALVARCPALERGAPIPRVQAEWLVGPAAAAKLGDLLA